MQHDKLVARIFLDLILKNEFIIKICFFIITIFWNPADNFPFPESNMNELMALQGGIDLVS